MSEDEDRGGSQKAAEAVVARFHDQLGPFVTAAEATRMPMVFTNAKAPGHPFIFANDSFLDLTGYERGEVLGQTFNFLLAHGADQDALAKVEAEFSSESHWQTEMIECRRRNGSTLWASLYVSPVRDAGGKIVQHFASFHDLTRHHDAQAQSQMLINELNHRVKNILATVQSIVSQAHKQSSDVEVAREAIEARLVALSRSHDLLTRERWTSAGLRDVVVSAMEPFGITNGSAKRFTIKGESIRFPPRAVLALSTALHELATNAVKYGAFSNNVGHVSIEWSAEASARGQRVVFHWRETDGPLVMQPTRAGFGSQVIERGLAHELDGDVSLDYRPEGLVCTIDMPVPHGARDV